MKKYGKMIIFSFIFVPVLLTIVADYTCRDILGAIRKGRLTSSDVKVVFSTFLSVTYVHANDGYLIPSEDVDVLLSKIKENSFFSNESIMRTNFLFHIDETTMRPHSILHGIHGSVEFVPTWLYPFLFRENMWLMRLLLVKSIAIEYDPWRQLLFFSLENPELGFEYENGICVSNIPPEILNIDMQKFNERFDRINLLQFDRVDLLRPEEYR